MNTTKTGMVLPIHGIPTAVSLWSMLLMNPPVDAL
jgi:hypothetical protein